MDQTVTPSQQAVMDRAVRQPVANYSPQGQRVGWLMIASILIEAWDLYSISFALDRANARSQR